MWAFLEDYKLISDMVGKYFSIMEFNNDPDTPYFVVANYSPEKFSALTQELDQMGYVPFINPHDLYYQIKLAQKREKGRSRVHVNLILFVATLGTTLLAGYIMGKNWVAAFGFAVAIMAIIGTHETAHFMAARKHGVKATLPYFIPAPTIIGTFGAVINVKSPIPDRNALFDLGISGPLAGLLVTVPVLIVGLSISTVTTQTPSAMTFTPPLLMDIIAYFTAPAAASGQMVYLHPVAFAGWVGLLVTMLNLMPVAFLDGGHISRSIFSEKAHFWISAVAIIVTLLLGWFFMAIIMILVLLKNKVHPGALDNVVPLTRGRKIMAFVALVILILCLAPVPFVSL
jgi:membrane-associated protease RseP (regulator of RpoE activity)